MQKATNLSSTRRKFRLKKSANVTPECLSTHGRTKDLKISVRYRCTNRDCRKFCTVTWEDNGHALIRASDCCGAPTVKERYA